VFAEEWVTYGDLKYFADESSDLFNHVTKVVMPDNIKEEMGI